MARGVGQGVVVALEGDVVAGAEVGQAVGQLAVGIEAAGQLQRAQAAAERQRHVVAVGGPLDEGGVELGVVGGEHRPGEAVAQLVEHGVGLRGAAQRSAG